VNSFSHRPVYFIRDSRYQVCRAVREMALTSTPTRRSSAAAAQASPRPASASAAAGGERARARVFELRAACESAAAAQPGICDIKRPELSTHPSIHHSCSNVRLSTFIPTLLLLHMVEDHGNATGSHSLETSTERTRAAWVSHGQCSQLHAPLLVVYAESRTK
jgi:hypothetical protein